MGVHGLWELLRPAATRTSLAALGRDAFLANRNGLRAFVIGIDASIWIFHAQATHTGSNPFERTLFYKIAHLLQHPVLPVFVFDGPNKPVVKRNNRVHGRFGTSDAHSRKFKRLLDMCGLAYWNAPGEAEAELALMNRQGKIDAVLSDDVDALLFGATCILRNNSPTLSGATGGNGSRAEMRHYDMFRACDIPKAWAREDTSLKTEEDCRNAMILVALLSGGDYAPDGAAGIGPTLAMGLAHAGMAHFLKLYNSNRAAFDQKVEYIHKVMVDELRTNASGFVGKKYAAKARELESKLPTDVFNEFPLKSYLDPARSPDDPALGWPGFKKGAADHVGRWSLESASKACEDLFEWGTKELVCKKFAADNGLFCAEVMNEARLRVLAADKTRRKSRPSLGNGGLTAFYETSEFRQASLPVIDNGVPDHILKIHSTRSSPMCAEMTEFRLGFSKQPYIERCRNAMEGTRVDPSLLPPELRAAQGLVEATQMEATQSDKTAKDEIRMWIPDYLIRAAWSSIAEEYDASVAAKAAAKSTPKKNTATKRKGKNTTSGVTNENTEGFLAYFRKDCPQSPSVAASVESVSSSLSSVASASDRTPSPTPTRPRTRDASSPLTSAPPSPGDDVSTLLTGPTPTSPSPTPLHKSRCGQRTQTPTDVRIPKQKARSNLQSSSATVPAPQSLSTSRTHRQATPPSSPDIIAIDTPPTRRSTRKASARKAAQTDKRTHSEVSSSALSGSRTPRRAVPKRSKRGVEARGTEVEPIDLCDLDDELAPPLHGQPQPATELHSSAGSARRRGRPRKSATPVLPPVASSPLSSVPSPVPTLSPQSTPRSRPHKSPIPALSPSPLTSVPPSPTMPKDTSKRKSRSKTSHIGEESSRKTAATRKSPSHTSPIKISAGSGKKSTSTPTLSSVLTTQSTLDSLIVGRNRRKSNKPPTITEPKDKPEDEAKDSKNTVPYYTVRMEADGLQHIYIGHDPPPLE